MKYHERSSIFFILYFYSIYTIIIRTQYYGHFYLNRTSTAASDITCGTEHFIIVKEKQKKI